jgi:cytidylate kinase
MIVALYGPSSTGKTTIARGVRSETNISLRSCGEIVKSRADLLGMPVSDLPDDEHRSIDHETRAWAAANKPCLVEGRYLDYVLGPLGAQVTLIRLDATALERKTRRVISRDRPLTIPGDDPDLLDSIFCTRMYAAGKQLAPQLILNSSEMSVEACVQRVVTLIQKACMPRG